MNTEIMLEAKAYLNSSLFYVTAICQDVSRAFTFMDNLLTGVNGQLEDLLEPISDLTNPFHAEETLEIPDYVRLVNFMHGGDQLGNVLREIVKEADSLLGQKIDDPKNPTQEDLAVNVWLRKNVLQDDGSFFLDTSNVTGNGIILESHDRLLQTQVKINSVKLYGIDTFRNFKPSRVVGDYTIENHKQKWSWTFERRPSPIVY
jgi:hypothetical protein